MDTEHVYQEEQVVLHQTDDRFSAWSKPVSSLKFPDATAPGITNLNVDGRKVNGPLQGFGQLWQKTFKIQLAVPDLTPEDIIYTLKKNFPRFHARENRFYPSSVGIEPGEVLLINSMTPFGPVSTGMLVMYVDEESFTLISPEGHPESGWVTFSAYRDEDGVVTQVQVQARANDPIFEFGFAILGTRLQDSIWTSVLQSLAQSYGVTPQVEKQKLLLDNRRQWSYAKNVWKNAHIRTVLYWMGAPFRWVGRLFRRNSPQEETR